VLFEVVVEGPGHRSGDPWVVPILRRITTLGRAPGNRIVLTDRKVPRRCGLLLWRWDGPIWIARGRGEVRSIGRRPLDLGPYVLRTRLSRRLAWLALLPALAGAHGYLAGRWAARVTARRPVPSLGIAVDLPARGTFGPGRTDFRFRPPVSGGLDLHFTAGNVRPIERLEVLLNGRPVGTAGPAPQGWGTEERIPLPPGRIRPGENLLSFRWSGAEGEAGRWSVRDVYVTRALRAGAEGADAESLHAEARRLFARRARRPDLLERARRLLERAFMLWSSNGEAAPDGARRLRGEIDRELDAAVPRREP
jgi:hypothetical protein